MHKTPPLILGEVLTYQQDHSTVEVIVGSARWYAWLETTTSFTFRNGQGSFTVRKERAGNQRGEPYWRAYQKREGKLHRVYLGQSEELTLERLQSVADALASGEAGTGLAASAFSQTKTHRRQVTGAPSPHEGARSKLLLASPPMPLTTLIGREQEVQAIGELISRPEVRLLTITGTGGVGKTRLALEVAHILRTDFADGVCFVPLASVSDPTRIMAAIAHALGLWEVAALSLEEQVQSILRERHLLLLLDNFEQVVQGGSQIASLLASCLHLRLLVTSRAALHLSGEHEFLVSPLAVPDLTQVPSPETLMQSASAQLFVLRTQAIQPAFHVTPTNAGAIAEICVHLDGLPLAIELAAARSKLLPPQMLMKRLSHRFEILTGGAQDLPARQQTLRNTLLWSYDLLMGEEQRLFRWLSIFVGGCTLEAAEALCQSGRKDSDQNSSVFEGVASLLDKSLAQQTELEGEVPRLVMLETLREFGLECLGASGELEAARKAHVRYFLALAEQAASEMRSPKQAIWLQRLEREHDNMRAALEWTLEEGEEQEPERTEQALRLSAALEIFWRMHGHFSEARTFLERVLTRGEGERSSLRARVLRVTAEIARWQGEYNRTEMLAQQSLALCRELGDTRGIANSLILLQEVAYPRGKSAEAFMLLEQLAQLMRQIDEPGEVAYVLFHLAEQVSFQGDYPRGASLFEEALQLFEKADHTFMVGHTLVRSTFYLWCSATVDVATLRQRLKRGQTIVAGVGDRSSFASSLSIEALIALSEGETTKAYDLAQESLAIFQEIGNRWYIAQLLHILGRVEAQQGDLRAARDHYLQSQTLAQELGEKWITPFNLERLADVLATEGEFRWAAQLWGAAEALREETSYPLPPVDHPVYEQAVSIVRMRLGASAFASAWQEGRTMAPEHVLAARKQVNILPQTPAKSRSTLPIKPSPRYPAGLTAREAEVLRLLAQGLTNAQIAEQLVIAKRTVNTHLTSIFSKIGVSTRTAAAIYALEHDLK